MNPQYAHSLDFHVKLHIGTLTRRSWPVLPETPWPYLEVSGEHRLDS